MSSDDLFVSMLEAFQLKYSCFYSDRFRTMINVLGDALAAGIIDHLCRKDFPLSDAGKVQSLQVM